LKNLAPTSPQEGPPLPKAMNIKWPWKREGKAPQKIEKGIKIFTGPELPTPFGKVKLPDAELPPIGFPKLDENGKKALLHAIGSDLTIIPGLIPWVGDIIGDTLSDLHTAEIRKLLMLEDYTKFLEYTKVGPDAMAILRVYVEKEILSEE